MSARKPYGRRSRYTGSLYTRADRQGRETYYGHWRADGQQIKRRIGLKRPTGTREGLTRKEAEQELARLIAETKPTPVEVGETLTIADLGGRYLADLVSDGRKKATIVAVTSILRVWLEPFFGEQDVTTITEKQVEDLIRNMKAGTKPGVRQKGDRRYGKPVGSKSIRNYVGCLSALLNFAMRQKTATGEPVLTVNVASHVKLPPKPEDGDVRFLTLDEVFALVDAAQPGEYEALDRALYLTAAMTGLRQGELVALRWRNIDFPALRIRVRENYVLGEVGTPKSKRSTRSVPMADEVAGELERYFKACGEPADDALVFADPLTGSYLDKAAVLRRFKRALTAAKLDESHRFHDLRHSFGTQMAAAGVPMRTLQEFMGHRDIETTQRYADYAPNANEAAYVNQAFTRERPTAVEVAA
jgi:integrase